MQIGSNVVSEVLGAGKYHFFPSLFFCICLNSFSLFSFLECNVFMTIITCT